MVRAYAKIIGEQCRLQSYELGMARCQSTRMPKEEMETSVQRGYEAGRGQCEYGHRSQGVEEED